MIAAALGAIPLIAQAGQGLINTVGQDVSGFLGAGQTGQNVPGPAGSAAAGSTQPASPVTVSTIAQTLSSSVLGVLNRADSDLAAASSFAGGHSSVSKSQFESAAQSVSGFLGQSSTAATSAAGQVFDAVDPSGSGQISAGQLSSYLGQLQGQAAAKYQAADSLVSNFTGQMSNLLSGRTSTTA